MPRSSCMAAASTFGREESEVVVRMSEGVRETAVDTGAGGGEDSCRVTSSSASK